MPVTIGAKQLNDFTNPIGVLTDCHRRIEHFLSVITAMSGRCKGSVLSPDEQAALTVALTYFRKSAPRHTDDEEESLFPALRRSGSKELAAALSSLDRLHDQHVSLESLHNQVDLFCGRWLERGVLGAGDRSLLDLALDRLSSIYAEHIAAEESVVFPLAARVLSAETLAEVGREMASRRGIDLTPSGAL
ncbi:MAG: hemerythrin domain-containing protein [Blastocatellia bacterium]